VLPQALITEKPLATCGCRKFQIDPLGDHLSTCTVQSCTAHSGTKKAHDWSVDQLADLFRTTHKVKTQQVIESRGHHCGDIKLEGYLASICLNHPDPISFIPLAVDTSVRLYDDVIQRVVSFSCTLIVRHLLWIMNCRRNRFRFLRLKGSVGLILTKTSTVRISIPLDLSSRSFIPCHCCVSSVLVSPPLLTPSLVLFPP
jgi:hypothetical protein